MIQSTLQHEWDDFFSLLNGDHQGLSSGVTKSAYCQARQKLSATAFIALNQVLCHEFYRHDSHHLWREHRLLAVDGSIPELPPSEALEKHYGNVNPQAHRPGARLSTLYDPLNGLTLDTQPAPCSVGERELARLHLAAALPGD